MSETVLILTIDPGERDAILLAEELTADGILIDDLAGRKFAIERRLRV
jgi:predicted nucleic acid-binding protein